MHSSILLSIVVASLSYINIKIKSEGRVMLSNSLICLTLEWKY